VVSLHTDGRVYPSSPEYPNIVGVATSHANAGESVRVLVAGVALVVADEAVSPGDPLTYSPFTPGRVVPYTGHTHPVSLSTSPFVVSVGADVDYSSDPAGYVHHTHEVSTSPAVTGVSLLASTSRVLGVALTGATGAGQAVLALVLPSRG
jgi:hypothetical protein